MGIFDSIQEHGITSIVVAIVLIGINLYMTNRMQNRSIKIETITKERNLNIEKVRGLMADNLSSAHKVRSHVSKLCSCQKKYNQNPEEHKEERIQLESEYYELIAEHSHLYNLLSLYLLSIDPLVDTKKINERYTELSNVIKINIKECVGKIDDETLDEQVINKNLKKYKEDYNYFMKNIIKESSVFIKQWLEESYIEVIGKKRYTKLKKK
ncbi:hypothetical protein [Abyssicoccus albus]|uniref:Uncharacterized protein n=1 Tax=Abyssicoccus albus TaxID=1817405 RepID=A0A3N5BCM9_9BACL|nr:hypothetical protein [Abyssicoccus albus]RPF55177.1 hypothetical protein EDD62_1502 [Abyssicoccus albus]